MSSKGKKAQNLTDSEKKKCHAAIHSAAGAAAAAGAIPIPIADAVPITAAQVSMIVALGRIFELELSASLAKAIALQSLAIAGGRHIFASAVKVIPVAGSIVGATTAAGVTEALGWLVASDFKRISTGQRPENIAENIVAPLMASNGIGA